MDKATIKESNMKGKDCFSIRTPVLFYLWLRCFVCLNQRLSTWGSRPCVGREPFLEVQQIRMGKSLSYCNCWLSIRTQVAIGRGKLISSSAWSKQWRF